MIQSLHIGCLYDKKSEKSCKAFEELSKNYNLSEVNLHQIENFDVIITPVEYKKENTNFQI